MQFCMIGLSKQIMKTSQVKGTTLAILAAIFWGISGTSGQYLFEQKGLNVEWLITTRLLMSGFVLLVFTQFGQKTTIFGIWRNRKDAAQLFVFSMVGMLAVQYTYFAAIKHSNAATATVLQYSGPIMIAVYLSIKKRQLPPPKEGLAIGLAVIGTFLLVTHGDANALTISPVALFLGLSSAVALAIYTLQPARLLAKYEPSVVIGWGMLCGGLVFSFVKAPWDFQGIWDTYTLFNTAAIIVLGTLVAFSFYLYAVRLIGGQKASLLASAEPLAATILAVYWLAIPFSWTDWIGSFCIISTVFLLSRSNRKR